MRDFHEGETHLKWKRDLTGSRESISVMISWGRFLLLDMAAAFRLEGGERTALLAINAAVQQQIPGDRSQTAPTSGIKTAGMHKRKS